MNEIASSANIAATGTRQEAGCGNLDTIKYMNHRQTASVAMRIRAAIATATDFRDFISGLLAA